MSPGDRARLCLCPCRLCWRGTRTRCSSALLLQHPGALLLLCPAVLLLRHPRASLLRCHGALLLHPLFLLLYPQLSLMMQLVHLLLLLSTNTRQTMTCQALTCHTIGLLRGRA